MKNIVTILLLITSCSAEQVSNKETKPTNITENTVEIRECIDQSGEIAKCVSDEDCCPNFVCSCDPEKSRVQKFCAQGR